MDKEVVIVGRDGCSFTAKAIDKAKSEGYNYTYVSVNSMPSRDMGEPFYSIAKEQGHRTFPCIFKVNYVGGFNDWN